MPPETRNSVAPAKRQAEIWRVAARRNNSNVGAKRSTAPPTPAAATPCGRKRIPVPIVQRMIACTVEAMRCPRGGARESASSSDVDDDPELFREMKDSRESSEEECSREDIEEEEKE